MKKVLKFVGVLIAVLVVAALGVYLWASMTTSRMRAQVFQPEGLVDFPIPFPLDPSDVAAMGLSDDAARQLAQTRAVERGKHLVSARYTCTGCHSANFGGGIMVDSFAIGHLLAPNLTLGTGSRTANFQARDWDRIVRHGVRQDGHPAVMPSDDFWYMSDQELSDIVSYIRSLPPVDNTVPQSTFGPVGTVLVAAGKLPFSAMLIASHPVPHMVQPPVASASADFGKHLATVCMGCHGPDFSGGPITGGDPELASGAQSHTRRDRAPGVDVRPIRDHADDGQAAGRVRASRTDGVDRAVWPEHDGCRAPGALGVSAVPSACEQDHSEVVSRSEASPRMDRVPGDGSRLTYAPRDRGKPEASWPACFRRVFVGND